MIYIYSVKNIYIYIIILETEGSIVEITKLAILGCWAAGSKTSWGKRKRNKRKCCSSTDASFWEREGSKSLLPMVFLHFALPNHWETWIYSTKAKKQGFYVVLLPTRAKIDAQTVLCGKSSSGSPHRFFMQKRPLGRHYPESHTGRSMYRHLEREKKVWWLLVASVKDSGFLFRK